MNNLRHNQKGYLGVIIVMIVAVITLTVATTIALSGVTEMQTGDEAVRSRKAFERAEACSEEAYYRLKRNPGFAGGTIPFADGSCTISVSGAGSSRIVITEATHDNFTRSVVSEISLTSNFEATTEGVVLADWQE